MTIVSPPPQQQQPLEQIVDLLQQIKANQERKTPFGAGTALVGVLAVALGFVLSLALNDFFSQLFGLIKINGNPLLGAAIYALVMLVVIIFLLWLLYRYLAPIIIRKLDPL